MRRLLNSILFSVLLLPMACARSGDTGQKPPPLPRETGFGHLGQSKTGEFEGRIPFYRDGDLMVYSRVSSARPTTQRCSGPWRIFCTSAAASLSRSIAV
jgi:hypothetical protein